MRSTVLDSIFIWIVSFFTEYHIGIDVVAVVAVVVPIVPIIVAVVPIIVAVVPIIVAVVPIIVPMLVVHLVGVWRWVMGRRRRMVYYLMRDNMLYCSAMNASRLRHNKWHDDSTHPSLDNCRSIGSQDCVVE